MKAVVIVATLVLATLSGCDSTDTSPISASSAGTCAGPTDTAPTERPRKQDRRFLLASMYLSGENLRTCLSMLEGWEVSSGARSDDTEITSFTPWGTDCDYIMHSAFGGEFADVMTEACEGGAQIMSQSLYWGVGCLSSTCGLDPLPSNHIFTPQFVSDHRGALDHLFHLDGRGVATGADITTERIFSCVPYIEQFPTFREIPGAVGNWVASCIIVKDIYDERYSTEHIPICTSVLCLYAAAQVYTEDQFAWGGAALVNGSLGASAVIASRVPVAGVFYGGLVMALGDEMAATGSEVAREVHRALCNDEDVPFYNREEFMEDFVPSMPQAYYDPFFEATPPQVWDINPEEIVP